MHVLPSENPAELPVIHQEDHEEHEHVAHKPLIHLHFETEKIISPIRFFFHEIEGNSAGL